MSGMALQTPAGTWPKASSAGMVLVWPPARCRDSSRGTVPEACLAATVFLTYRSLPDLSRLCPHFEFMHVLVSCIGGIRFNCFVPTLSSVFPHYSFLPSPPSTTPKVPPLGAAQRRSALPRRVSAPVFANTF
ncbi:unnamed protein product [Prorocentrum cordatum]|uniref:Mannosyltransferase n=1 Tax=Prorocentrum cordatum TaxID=2364126 RepID=A0ABN9VLU8_9DINO|nr:unnamed protein product [Polarella glacialis]